MEDEKIKEIRKKIQEVIIDIGSLDRSRHSSIAITKLEDAQMRMGCLFSPKETKGIIKR